MVIKTLHAMKQISKRKITDKEISEVLGKGDVTRITFNGRKMIVYKKIHVIVSADGAIVTAYRWKKHPHAKSSKQFKHCRANKQLAKLKGVKNENSDYS